MTETTPEEILEKVVVTLYAKQGRKYLDHLWQGGLVQKVIRVTYDPITQEVKHEVENVR